MSKRYIKVEGNLVEVSQEVYNEYYRMDRKERYQIERERTKGTLYYEAFSREDMSGEEMIADTNQKSVEDQAELACMTPILLAALNSLDENEIKLIRCIYYENKPIRSLSREWNIPETSIRRRRDQVLLKLLQMLE